MDSPEIHATLSASSSHRWLNCPPSATLAKQFPSKTSEYAERGRTAHAIAELKATSFFRPNMLSAKSYRDQLKKLKADPWYESVADSATDEYLDFLKEAAMSFTNAPFVALETRVDYSDIAPGGFGTADCIMVGDDAIHIIDYKNGSGVPVDAEWNSQMMLYAWGALRAYASIFGDRVSLVRISIVQPHAGGEKTWELTREQLTAWAFGTVKPTAELAASGGGDYCAGDWCRFCPAKAQCRTRSEMLLSMESDLGKSPPLLSDAEIGDILVRAQTLEAWVKDLKDYALSTCLAGGCIPGFKVVEGRGSRDWAEGVDSAFENLRTRGIQDAMLWEKKPVSVAGLERILGKKSFVELADDLVVKRPGKPALVPESDKRPPYNAATQMFKAVGYG